MRSKKETSRKNVSPESDPEVCIIFGKSC